MTKSNAVNKALEDSKNYNWGSPNLDVTTMSQNGNNLFGSMNNKVVKEQDITDEIYTRRNFKNN